MADKHANMPGLGDQSKKPEQTTTPEKPRQAPKPEKSDKAPDAGRPGHQHNASEASAS